MEPGNKFQEVWELFLRPETSDWRIIREDGSEENFDPATMINSFIESEVPLPHAFALFDLFLQKAGERFPDKRLTHAEIHAWVSEAFLSYPHKGRTIWFANYENVFSPDLTVPDEEGFVYARKVSEMRKIIVDLLEKEFDIVVPSGAEITGFRAISSQQLDDAVRRIIKLVRQCGFYKLPVTFLRDFCRELAKHSSKLFLPAAQIDAAALKKRLNDAEEQIALARIQYQNHPRSGQSMLLIASQVMTLTWLQWNRFVAKPSPVETLAQMREVLHDGRQLSGTNQPVAVIFDELRDRFQAHGLKPERLIQAADELSKWLETERLAAPDFLLALEAIERLLNLIRIATQADSDLSDVIAAFHADPGSRINRLHAVATYLQTLKINAGMLSIGDVAPIPVLRIEIGKLYTPLLERGRAVHLMLDADNIDTPLTDLKEFMAHMAQESDAMGLYVSSSLVSSKLPEDIFRFLKDLAANGQIIVPTGSTQLLRILSARDKMFDEVSELANKTFRNVGKASPPPAAGMSIDPAIKGYDREVLDQAAHELRKGSPLACATRLGQLLEDVLRLNCQLVLSYGEAELKWKEAWGSNPSFSPVRFERQGSKDSIELLREARRLARGFPLMQPLLPQDSDLAYANTARDLRNTITHVAEQERLTPDLLRKIVALVKSIGPFGKWELVATVAGFDASQIIISCDGTYKSLSTLKLARSQTGVVADSIYFLIRGETDFLIPLMRPCGKCGRSVRWRFDIGSVDMTCPFCRASMPRDPRINHLRKMALTVEKEVGQLAGDGKGQEVALVAPGGHAVVRGVEPVRIFISYAHEDRKYMEQNGLAMYLKALERDSVAVWHDGQILTSELWNDKIKAEMEKADIAVVLISQAFLNSEYIRNDEIARFLELRKRQGLRIFPVILSSCAWAREDWLKSTQALPTENKNIESHFRDLGKRKTLYNRILEDLRKIVEEVRQERQKRH